MRQLLDVNIIVAVLRADSELHSKARTWFLGATGSIVALPETLAAAVRVLTNDRIWAQVPTVGEATAAVNDLVAGAQISIAGSSPGAWSTFTEFVSSRKVSHRDVPDALLAAQAVAVGAELITFDRGFRDYPGLKAQVL